MAGLSLYKEQKIMDWVHQHLKKERRALTLEKPVLSDIMKSAK
jgi:hypothetical protein